MASIFCLIGSVLQLLLALCRRRAIGVAAVAAACLLLLLDKFPFQAVAGVAFVTDCCYSSLQAGRR